LAALVARLPILLLGVGLGAIYLLWPSQLPDLVIIAGNYPVQTILAIFLPLASFGLAHVILLGERRSTHLWVEVGLAAVPTGAYVLFVAKSAPGDLIFVGPIAGLFVALIGLLATEQFLRARALAWTAAILASAIFLGATAAWPIEFPRLIGPLGIVVTALGFYSILVAALQKNPIVGIVFVVFVIVCGSFDSSTAEVARLPVSNDDLVRLDDQDRVGSAKWVDQAFSGTPSVQSELVEWLTHRADYNDYAKEWLPYPVYVVSAQGGGIFAAAHALFELSALQAYCPTFAQHVFAAVGISGGSLGLAQFAANLQGQVQSPHSARCHVPSPTIPAFQSEGTLAPVLAAMLFPDMVDLAIPGRIFAVDRGELLQRSLGSITPSTRSFFDADLFKSWSAEGVSPALIFGSTNELEGTRYMLGQLRTEAGNPLIDWDWFGYQSRVPGDVRVGTAAAISARFSWITPTARLPVESGFVRILADGGYVDNAGSLSGLDVVSAIEETAASSQQCQTEPRCAANARADGRCAIVLDKTFLPHDWKPRWWGPCEIHVFLSYITIETMARDVPLGRDFNPGAEGHQGWGNAQSFFLDPLATLAAASGSTASGGYNRVSGELCAHVTTCGTGYSVDEEMHLLYVPTKELNLPLGWDISPDGISNIRSISARPELCGIPPAIDPKDPQTTIEFARVENGNSAKAIAEQLDLSRHAEEACKQPD